MPDRPQTEHSASPVKHVGQATNAALELCMKHVPDTFSNVYQLQKLVCQQWLWQDASYLG